MCFCKCDRDGNDDANKDTRLELQLLNAAMFSDEETIKSLLSNNQVNCNAVASVV